MKRTINPIMSKRYSCSPLYIPSMWITSMILILLLIVLEVMMVMALTLTTSTLIHRYHGHAYNMEFGQKSYYNSITTSLQSHHQPSDYNFYSSNGLYNKNNNERIFQHTSRKRGRCLYIQKNHAFMNKRPSTSPSISFHRKFSSSALQFQLRPSTNAKRKINRKGNRRRKRIQVPRGKNNSEDIGTASKPPTEQSSSSSSSTVIKNGKSRIAKYQNFNNDKGTNAPTWLEQATKDILDLSRIPLGQLTSDDIESITGLMANWAKNNKKNNGNQQTQYSAIQVEKLLKRVVDDHNHGNNSVKVTTRMYTMAIDAWAKTGGKKAAERAHIIHSNMVEMYKHTGDENIKPSTISYNAVLNAWSKSGCEDACYKAESILEEMLDSYYTMSKSSREFIVDEDILSRVEDSDGIRSNSAVNERVVKPDVVSFTSVIDTWAKSGHPNGAEKAMSLLKQMERLYTEQSEIGMKPNVYTYSACINAFAKSDDLDSPKQAELLLEDMKNAYKNGDMDVKPNVINYNSVINAWGRCKAKGSAQRAAEILKVMEKDNVEVDALSYSLVVSAWAHSAENDATIQAEAVLSDMENWARNKNMAIDQAFNEELRDNQHKSQEQQEKSSHIKVENIGNKISTPSSLPTIRVHLDVDCYNTVLISLSKRQETDAPDRALAIIRRMKMLAEEGFETVRPNAKSWNSVLNTLSRSNDTTAAQRAEDVLREMNEEGIVPDVFSYAALLHAYQKNTFPGSAQRADDIVRKMEKFYLDGKLSSGPDVYHYTIVCACWARSGERIAAERCWEILQHMEKRVEEGQLKCRPNVRTYNAVIDAYSRAHYVEEAEALLQHMIDQYERGDHRVKPDGFTFNAVINAWTRSRRKDSGDGAERILKLLLEFYDKGNPDVVDSRSFSHIIDYYARCHEPDAGKKAECLLQVMADMYKKGEGDVIPNMFCFNSVIHAYSRSHDQDAGLHAERVLRLLEDLHSNYGIYRLKPNTFIMNAVIHAWSRSANPLAGERVEEILVHMEEQYRVGKYQMQPNTRTYGLALATWAKSIDSNKAYRAYNILRRMDEESKNNEHVTKNVHCYNAVINAAAFTDGGIEYQQKAFQIAISTLDELIACKDIEPTSSSFGTFIKACGKLSSLPRNLVDSKLEWAFYECRELGLVNDFILTQMRYSCQASQYQKLLGKLLLNKTLHDRVEMIEVPFWWRRNVAEHMSDTQKGDWWKNEDL